MVTKPSTKKRYKQMANSVKGGMTVTEVAAKFQASERTIRFAMAHHNVTTTTRGQPLVILAEIYRSLPSKGIALRHSFAVIGQRSGGVSRQRVHQIFNEAIELGLLKASLTPSR